MPKSGTSSQVGSARRFFPVSNDLLNQMADDAVMVTSSKAPTPEPVRPWRTPEALTRLLDMAPVAMLLLERGGSIAYANRALGTLLGLPATQRHRPDLSGHLYPGDGPALALQCERLWRGEATAFRGEHRLLHADGAPVWALVDARLMSGESGEPDLLVLQLSNIQLQKQAEAALVYAEARWNAALESARQGVWDYDMRRDRMFYSRMWRVLRGIPDDEDIGIEHDANWLERIHPDDRGWIKDFSKRQGQGEDGYDRLEYRELTRSGEYIWILSRGKPIEWDAEGRVLRAVGTDTDITHLKTVELELAAERQRLRVTLESIADGMISTDLSGRVVFMNPAAEQLTGLAAGEAIGRPVREVVRLRNERDDGDLICPVETCLAGATQVRLDDDSVLMAHDGPQRDIRCTASPLIGEDGVLSGAVLVFQDVTQSRAMQRQLAYSAAHDDLTGLPNRASFERSLGEAIASARAGQRQHCLIYLDLDRFKPVNDTAGHAAGDELLRQVARTIKGVCRSHDMAARIGGDEFVVILEDCPLANGRAVAEKIVRAIGALVFTWAGRDYSVGASAGITAITMDPASPLGFMGEADAACYAAKANGRGCVMAFPEMTAR